MRFDYNNDAYYYGGDGTTKIIEDLDVFAQGSPTIVSQSSNPFGASPNHILLSLPMLENLEEDSVF